MPAAPNSYKQYSLSGVNRVVDLGKDGLRLANVNNDHVEAQNVDSTALVPFSGADPVDAQNFVTKHYLENTNLSANITLQTPTDGTFTDGAITDWVVGTTTVSQAVDDLNEVLGKLVPTKPDNLSSKTISVTGGSNQLLCSGATDNTGGSLPAAGTSVYTVFSSSFTSSLATGGTSGVYCYDAASGTLSAKINGSTNGSITFDSVLYAGSNQQNGALLVTDDNWYPAATPNFWQSFQAKVNASGISVGYNNAKLSHSTTGDTNTVSWLYDNVAATPTVSSVYYTEGTNVGYVPSSGIPHLTTGHTLKVNAVLAGLTGQSYTSGTVFTVGTRVNCGSATFTAAQLGTGLSLPLAANLGNQSVADRVLTLNSNNVFSTNNINTSATNVRGTSATTQASGSTLLTWTGTNVGSSSGTPVMERSIYSAATGGYGIRVLLNDSSATPNDGITAESMINSGGINHFNPYAVDLTSLVYEASVVGGVLKHDITNYSSGYIPAGPNLSSGRSAAQYATFYIKATAISSFKVDVAGTYAGIWVKLANFNFTAAGLSKGSAYDAVNGWMDLTAAAPAVGMPGTSTNGMGCASGQVATGSTGTFTATFNNGSSTYAADNMIMIRIKLTSGQSISTLRFLA